MLLKFLWSLLFVIKCVYADTPKALIGVPAERIALYSNKETFSCLDGTLTIPYEYVNDDYCDCINDGSDEPGTSACPNGLFHCKNVGFVASNIPSSRVNDGICDCCDGSDEYNSTKVCENNCNILGLEARKEQERIIAIFKEGNVLRLQLIEKGKELKYAKKAKYEELSNQVQEAENIKKQFEEVKKEKEEAEKIALDAYNAAKEQLRLKHEQEEKQRDEQLAFNTFIEIDKNSDKNIDLDELQQYVFHSEGKSDKAITEEEAKSILGAEENLNFESFLSSGWSQFKQLSHSTLFEPPVETETPDIVTEETISHSIDRDTIDHTEDTSATDEDIDEEEEADELEAREDNHGEAYPEPEQTEKEEDPGYDENTLKLIEDANKARKEFEDADRNFRDISREMKQIEDVLSRDYGTDGEFAYMDGECYEFTDKEYVYRICPFDQVTQSQKSGGAEVRLGRWQNWDSQYQSMLYTNGQGCWNGPNRQSEVKLNCGLNTEVTLATEPSRCIYLFHMDTPAACVLEKLQQMEEQISHDEL